MLPTHDTILKVTRDNKVVFKMYEKETCSKQTIHKKSAMGENMKNQILSQDLIRRLMNTSEDLDKEYREQVVDDYAKKILNSGYSRDQTIRILVNGIKGYENKRRRRIKEGRRLRTTARESRSRRYRKKLLAKSTWFKGSKDSTNTIPRTEESKKKKQKSRTDKEPAKEQTVYKSVLFVENTEGGEFLNRMRELSKALSSSLGFGIKIVERCGSSLRSKFPLSTLWEGSKCGRKDCTTCNQNAEKIPHCTKTSVVYENICQRCNKEAGGKKDLENVVEDSIYVGESSRSIYERSKEHWEDWRSKSSKSHILKHQELAHGGAEDPLFIMRPVKYFRTALSRQVGEAVRIMRRGGACSILNSKSEYDRCRIPRLVMEEEDETENRRMEEKDLQEDLNSIEEHADAWRNLRFSEKQKEDKLRWAEGAKTTKRRIKNKEAPGIQHKRIKKLKYDLLGESWGEGEQEMPLECKDDSNPLSIPYPSTPPSPPPPQKIIGMVDRPKQTRITSFLSEGSAASQTQSQTPEIRSHENEDYAIFEQSEKPTAPEDNDVFQCVSEAGSIGTTDTKIPGSKNTAKTPKISVAKPDAQIGPLKREVPGPAGRSLGPIFPGAQSQIEVASNDSNRELPPCITDKRGHCDQHAIKMSKVSVSSKKWCDRGKGKGFGWKTFKTTKYICKLRLSSTNNTPDLDLTEGGSVIDNYQHEKKKGGSEMDAGVDNQIGVPEHSKGSGLEITIQTT